MFLLWQFRTISCHILLSIVNSLFLFLSHTSTSHAIAMQWNEQGDQVVGFWTQSSKTASLPQNKAAKLQKLTISMKLLRLVPQPALTPRSSHSMGASQISRKILVSHQRKLGLIGETGRITGPMSWLMRVGAWEWGMVTCSLAIHPWLYDALCIYVVLIMFVKFKRT